MKESQYCGTGAYNTVAVFLYQCLQEEKVGNLLQFNWSFDGSLELSHRGNDPWLFLAVYWYWPVPFHSDIMTMSRDIL